MSSTTQVSFVCRWGLYMVWLVLLSVKAFNGREGYFLEWNTADVMMTLGNSSARSWIGNNGRRILSKNLMMLMAKEVLVFVKYGVSWSKCGPKVQTLVWKTMIGRSERF